MILYRLCLTGLLVSLSAAAYLIFFPQPSYNQWLLPLVCLAGWFSCGAALLTLNPALNAKMDEGLSWWQRQKFRLRWLASRTLLMAIGLLTVALVFISFRALRVF